VYAEEFRDLSLEILSHCHDQDDTRTMRLLTAELSHWGNHTCLSLAVSFLTVNLKLNTSFCLGNR
jgi:hypothetical protein